MVSKKDKSEGFVFPKWVNSLPSLIILTLLGSIVFFVYLFYVWFSPSHLEVGYQPIQPISYSHQLHAGELGIDCRYCHYNVETSAHANIPSAELCLNCHNYIKTDSEEIKYIKIPTGLLTGFAQQLHEDEVHVVTIEQTGEEKDC